MSRTPRNDLLQLLQFLFFVFSYMKYVFPCYFYIYHRDYKHDNRVYIFSITKIMDAGCNTIIIYHIIS